MKLQISRISCTKTKANKNSRLKCASYLPCFPVSHKIFPLINLVSYNRKKESRCSVWTVQWNTNTGYQEIPKQRVGIGRLQVEITGTVLLLLLVLLLEMYPIAYLDSCAARSTVVVSASGGAAVVEASKVSLLSEEESPEAGRSSSSSNDSGRSRKEIC